MTLTTEFNQTPYWDDFDPNKNFHRVLFRPGLAVQTRELTQLQTILQNQIERFGDNIYVEGTIVEGCDFQYDTVSYVKLRDSDPGGNTVSVSVFANGIVEGLTSGVRAKVIAVEAGAEATAPNYNTLLVKYIDGGTSKTNKTFANNETIVYKPADGGTGQTANTLVSGAFGKGTIFSVSEGIIYGKGHFVRNDAQTLVLEKYSESPSYKVGFKIAETIVTSSGDTSLLDNASGSKNFNAPGANRLKLTPTLVKRSLTDTSNTEQLTSIFEVENGNIKTLKNNTIFDSIGKELAKRTFEESGNYMVKHINTAVKEHLDNGVNFGRYQSTDSPAGDKNKLAIGIEPGIAYVQGYRNEVLTTEYIETDKAIDTKEELGVNVTTNYGNYVIVDEVAGPWDPTLFQEVSLRNTASNAVSTGNYGSGGAPGSEIGTAKVRYIQYSSGNQALPTAQYRLYIFDIKMTSGTFADVRSFYINNTSGADCFADAVLESGSAVLKEPSFNRLVFKTGVNAVKQLTNNTGTINTNYQFRDSTTISFSTSGTGTLTISGTHAGGTEELPYGVGTLNDTQKRQVYLMVTTAGQTANLSGFASFTASSNTIVGNGGSIFGTEYKVGDNIQFANTTGGLTNTLKVVSIASASSMVVNPAPSIDSGTANTSSGARHYKVFPAGYVFDLTANGSSGSARSITVATSTTATIDLKENLNATLSTKAWFNNKRETANPATKTVRKNRFVKIDLSTHSEGTTGPWGFGVADVFNIRNVYLGTTYSTSNRNVTDQFRILRNSNDNYYDHSKLALKENSSLAITSSQKLLVEFDYFARDVSSGIGFFSVDSYPIDPNESTTNATAIATPQIPRYDSTSAGITYDLRDTIDFRPSVVATANDATTVSTATVNPANTTTLNIDSDGSYVPVADGTFESDLLYYLPRIDRVVMGKDGKKKVIKGVSSEKPVKPLEPAESMTLSILNIPPFPSLSLENAYKFGRVDQAVRVRPFFYKRYTMKDIAALETRLDRVEYYTALNVLEKAAKDLTIPDANGLDRFKNGIFVDAFFGLTNADLKDPSFNASVDTKKGELRPKFDQQNIDIQFNVGSSSNVTQKGKQVRLDVTSNTVSYTNDDIVYLGSSLGSATAAGTVRTVVANTSVVRLYLHNANGTFTTSSTLKKSGSAGTSTISTVQNAPSGEVITLPYSHQIYIDQPFASRVINPVGELQFDWVGNIQLFPEADHWVDTTQEPDVQFDLDLASNWQSAQQAWGTQWNEWNTTSSQTEERREVAGFLTGTGTAFEGGGHGALDEVTTTTTEQQVRTGTRLNVEVFNRTQSSGPFVRRTDIIPFMRSREVRFVATGMRPNTRVYPYFDNILVNGYVTPTTSAFANTGSAGSALTTDSNGVVYGVFTVPNDNTLKFRQGERPFRLVDISNTATQTGTQTTSAEANYTSLGLASSTSGITLNTREARVTTDTVSETRTVTSSFTGVQVHRDPVAQSFRIGDFEFNNLTVGDNRFGLGADGIFVSCIDLYFSQKSATAGIGVEIREMENGQITAVRVPFGWKRIESSDVNVSSDGSAVTPFYFDQPVYLRGDKEYAFIVKPDGSNPDYRMWISQLGETDTATGAIIDQQPAVGLLFTSANDRTYTPRQNQDVCFTIWRASFNKNLTGQAVFTNEDDEYLNITQIGSPNFQIGEKIRGESLLTIVGASNTAAFSVGDTVTLGSNTGKIRKIVATSPHNILKVDMKGTVGSSANVTFSGTSTYYGTANGFTSNAATGFVQYFNRTFGQLVINSSSGVFTANTTGDDGFYRGQVSNASAQVFGVRDYKMDVIAPKITEARYVDTSISWGIRTTSNTYTTSSTYTSIENFENNTFVDGEKVIAGRTNEVNNTSSAKTLFVRGTLTSNTDRLSPVIDLGRAKSVIAVHNIINNDNSGETGNYGNADARYITKKITLADGQEAEDLKVIISAYKPSGTSIDVYGRFQNDSDGDDFRDKSYTLLTQETASNTISSSVNSEDFVELEFGVPSTNATSTSAYKNSANNGVLRYYNSDGAYFDTYKYFSLKIVLRSSSGSALVPRVRDLRCIALQI